MKRTIEIKVGIETPWGTADHVRNIGGECYAVATSGHGGIFVPDEQLYKIPDAERHLAMRWSGSPNWYEEDCCAASVLKHIPETRERHTDEQVEKWWAGSVKPQLDRRANNDI